METEITIDLAERIAVLEAESDTMKQDLKDIKGKLDELLELKSRGMGALWLVSLLIGSGTMGLIIAIVNFVNRPHL